MTKQEQTKQMLKTLCDKFQCSAINRNYMAKSCKQCEDIVKALHEAGYGDISEYKAEIERLKDDYVKLQEQFADYQIASDKEIAAQAKQAKIDVLNELQTHSYYDDDYMDSYVFVSDIDELIEEIEK